MASFDFVCDARVSTRIKAKSRDEAIEEWRKFATSLEATDDLQTRRADRFDVALAHQEPEVSEVTGEHATDDSGDMQRPTQYVVIRLPQDAWDKLTETLELDANSSAFDPELRKEIGEALDQVEYVADSPSLVQVERGGKPS